MPNVEQITSKEELNFLYSRSAMTWEGLNKDDFEIAIKECGGQDAKGYLVKGNIMNEICHLSGNNAYPKDLNIFAIYPFKGLAFQYGARWMDDVIDNNARRENYHPFEKIEEVEE